MSTVFPPREISANLKTQLDNFLENEDFPSLYTSYRWENDTHTDEFPDILRLETQLSANAKADGATIDDIRDIAEWGRNSRNLSRIRCTVNPPLPGSMIYSTNGEPLSSLALDPIHPVRILDDNTRQVGPTYLSKVLRFALPEQYGAIDTQCAQAFGSDSNGRGWIPIKAINSGSGPNIPRNGGRWLDGYRRWINILRYFAHNLPANCPHPKGFVEAGLRAGNSWICADVEMALFSYASKVLNNG